MVPCDLHGIQLAKKDCLELEEVDGVFKMASKVIDKFHRAPLQLARLRAIMVREYGKVMGLLSLVIT